MPGSLNLSKISTTEIETNEIRSLDANVSISISNTDIKLQQLSSDPVSATAGQLYYNTNDNVIRFYNGTEWLNVSQGSTDSNFFENDVVLTSSYTITTNKNALTAGPVTVANGVIITVPAGSTWTIV